MSSVITVTTDGESKCPGGIVNLELYDAQKDVFVKNLVEDGSIYCIPANYSVRACTAACPGGDIKWVVFDLYNVSAGVPYPKIYSYNDTTKYDFYMNDKQKGDVFPVPEHLTPGVYHLVATPYGNYYNSNGVLLDYYQGTPYDVQFIVGDC